jgi:hypothetical protein
MDERQKMAECYNPPLGAQTSKKLEQNGKITDQDIVRKLHL